MANTLDVPYDTVGIVGNSGTQVIPPDIPGIVEEFDAAGTLALAERLQPDAKSLVIIAGASDLDLQATARGDLRKDSAPSLRSMRRNP